MDEYLGYLNKLLVEYTPKLVGAILMLVIGLVVIKIVTSSLRGIVKKSSIDITLQKFALNLINWTLKILLFVTVIGKLGIATTSFAAIIASAGLAIGLALQGSLSNFAGGVLIIIFKPFKIDDLVEAQGVLGVVNEIDIFTTKLIGLSNREIIIPNGSLSNGNIINYSAQGLRRVDLVFGVSYDADIKQTKKVLTDVVNAHAKVLKEPLPTVAVLELADSSVKFAVRPWCKPEDYWAVHFDITENVKEALDAAGIEIPYPHHVEIRKTKTE